MKFDHTNCMPSTSVIDVETKETLGLVKSVDTDNGEVERYHEPFNVFNQTYIVKFRSIYPIYGGNPAPGMFHCYGRLP